MEKYRLLPDKDVSTKYGTTIYRVQALKNFNDIKAGQLGGFVQCEKNLSNEGTCWVYPGAIVLGNAKVRDGAVVKDKAIVQGNAIIEGNAIISDFSTVCGNAKVSGKAQIREHAVVADYANVADCAEILAHAQVVGSAIVTGSTKVMNFTLFDQKNTNLQNTTSITAEVKQDIEAERQALEQELKAYEKKIGWNKRYNIMATISFGLNIYLAISSNFNNSILGLFLVFAALVYGEILFNFINLFIDKAKLKHLRKELQKLSELQDTKHDLKNVCAELQKLSEEISNQELLDIIKDLLETLSKSKGCISSLNEMLCLHLPEILGLLQKYLALGKERPKGYEDLIKYLQSVKEFVEEVTMKHSEMEEAKFAADASGLLSSIKMQV